MFSRVEQIFEQSLRFQDIIKTMFLFLRLMMQKEDVDNRDDEIGWSWFLCQNNICLSVSDQEVLTRVLVTMVIM